jgi:hypothetical protein
MKRLAVLAILFLAAGQAALAAFPGNGYWSVKPSSNRRDDAAQTTRPRRASAPLDIYPAYDPHFDNAIYGIGLTKNGGSAYLTNEYRGPVANMSYGYWDGGFSPGGIYSLSLYPHFDRPGFTYWQGGF